MCKDDIKAADLPNTVNVLAPGTVVFVVIEDTATARTVRKGVIGSAEVFPSGVRYRLEGSTLAAHPAPRVFLTSSEAFAVEVQ